VGMVPHAPCKLPGLGRDLQGPGEGEVPPVRWVDPPRVLRWNPSRRADILPEMRVRRSAAPASPGR
jgi:hypothetical protein